MDGGNLAQHLALPAPQLVDLISQDGWLRLQATCIENLGEDIRAFANLLGRPDTGRDGPILEQLTPHITESARAKSLSAIHGLSSFPLHTDGAHRARPPRFLLLACVRPGILPVPTLLQRFSDLGLTIEQRGLCSAATFLIKNGRRSFYSTIAGDRPYIRFDEGCMVAIDRAGKDISDAITASQARAEPSEVHWGAGDILAIDNWRVLHGRGRADTHASVDRLILRISIQ